MRRFLIPVFLFAVFLFSSPIVQEVNAKTSVGFGILPVIDTLPLIVGVENGYFQQEGIDLRLISFSSALERDLALQSGKINGYFGDLLNTLLLINAGQDISIFATVFHTTPEQRMFALLSSPGSGITGINQVEGETVALSRASVIEYIFDKIAARAGMNTAKIKRSEIRAIPIRYQMLMTNKVRLAVLPEPLATKAELDGAKVLADDRNLDTTLTVLAFKSDLARKNPDLVPRFSKAYNRAVDAVNRNPGAFKELLVQKTQFPPSLRQAFRVPSFPGIRRPPSKDVALVQEWLVERKLITKPRAYESVVLP